MNHPDHAPTRALRAVLLTAALLAPSCASGGEPTTEPPPQTMKEALIAACSAIDAPSLRGIDHEASGTKLAEEIQRRVTNPEFDALLASLSGMEPAERRARLVEVLGRHGLTECRSFAIPVRVTTAATPTPTPTPTPATASAAAPASDRATDPAFALREQDGMYVGRVDVACPAGADAWSRSDLRKGERLTDGRLVIELPHGGCPTWAGYTVVHGTGSPLPVQVCYERRHDLCEALGHRRWVFDLRAPLAANTATDVVYAALTRAP